MSKATRKNTRLRKQIAKERAQIAQRTKDFNVVSLHNQQLNRQVAELRQKLDRRGNPPSLEECGILSITKRPDLRRDEIYLSINFVIDRYLFDHSAIRLGGHENNIRNLAGIVSHVTHEMAAGIEKALREFIVKAFGGR